MAEITKLYIHLLVFLINTCYEFATESTCREDGTQQSSVNHLKVWRSIAICSSIKLTDGNNLSLIRGCNMSQESRTACGGNVKLHVYTMVILRITNTAVCVYVCVCVRGRDKNMGRITVTDRYVQDQPIPRAVSLVMQYIWQTASVDLCQ